MPNSYIVAGQAAPAAATDHTLYTVPAGKQFVASTLNCANRDKTGDPAEIRIAIVPTGETLANKHFIEYDRILDQRESFPKTIGVTLPAGCAVIVRSSTANVSFSLFGAEVTPAT
jgi:hypothetical protein